MHLGTRLCDHYPCSREWPCEKHGTREVATREVATAYAAAIRQAQGFCRGCGYHVCSCESAPRPRPMSFWDAMAKIKELDRESWWHTDGFGEPPPDPMKRSLFSRDVDAYIRGWRRWGLPEE